jgi:acetyl-CoA carboxylase carboxyl transferase subunit beta
MSRWLHLLLDGGLLERWATTLATVDPLHFNDGKTYPERIARALKSGTADEAIEVGQASIHGVPVAFGGFVFGFMGGSMGSVVGERIAVLFENALDKRLPVILMHASGGARMQEGILSLMQMAKGVSALARYRTAHLPYLSLCVHPTTGGVAASTALLGDVNLAEPNALIGFAGPRVIENTLRTKLPAGFQRSEFLLEHGMVDCVVPRVQLKQTLHQLLIHLGGKAA